ncbi:hypothetical protein Droror1_Dr00024825 [Drosera rotundifolia]
MAGHRTSTPASSLHTRSCPHRRQRSSPSSSNPGRRHHSCLHSNQEVAAIVLDVCIFNLRFLRINLLVAGHQIPPPLSSDLVPEAMIVKCSASLKGSLFSSVVHLFLHVILLDLNWICNSIALCVILACIVRNLTGQ